MKKKMFGFLMSHLIERDQKYPRHTTKAGLNSDQILILIWIRQFHTLKSVMPQSTYRNISAMWYVLRLIYPNLFISYLCLFHATGDWGSISIIHVLVFWTISNFPYDFYYFPQDSNKIYDTHFWLLWKTKRKTHSATVLLKSKMLLQKCKTKVTKTQN